MRHYTLAGFSLAIFLITATSVRAGDSCGAPDPDGSGNGAHNNVEIVFLDLLNPIVPPGCLGSMMGGLPIALCPLGGHGGQPDEPDNTDCSQGGDSNDNGSNDPFNDPFQPQ